ncbi:MAG: hypothetical protein IJH91_03140 [Mogibacterium sp.]|nr:hypothetical protein [Mogibacterium sp.]
MTKEEFRDAAITMLQDMIPASMKVTVRPQEITKANDQKLYGICFQREGSLSAPTYYVDDFFDLYLQGTPMQELMERLYKTYRAGPAVSPVLADAELPPYNKVKKQFTLRLLEKARNELFLENVPYREVGNGLVLVCDISFFSEEDGIYKTTINQDIVDKEGYDVDRMFRDALRNAPRIDPPRMMGNDLEPEDDVAEGVYKMLCLTTRSGSFGAAALFYPGMLRELEHIVEESYFVLPVSLHELLILPQSAVEDPEFLISLAPSANARIHPSEVLTDRILYYDRIAGELLTLTHALAAALRNGPVIDELVS